MSMRFALWRKRSILFCSVTELVLVDHRDPVFVCVCLPSVLTKRVLLGGGGGVAVLVVGLYDDLVCGVRVGRSAFAISN